MHIKLLKIAVHMLVHAQVMSVARYQTMWTCFRQDGEPFDTVITFIIIIILNVNTKLFILLIRLCTSSFTNRKYSH